MGIQQIRGTLQRAQEITQVVSEAETVADEAIKFCEAIKAQHNIQPKKLALSGGGKVATPVPPLAAGLTREIQTLLSSLFSLLSSLFSSLLFSSLLFSSLLSLSLSLFSSLLFSLSLSLLFSLYFSLDQSLTLALFL